MTSSAPRPAVHDLLGLRIVHASAEDGAIIELDLRDELRNNSGYLHGGFVATLADHAAGVAAARAAGRGPSITQTLHLDFLAPITDGPARAIATVLRVGGTTVFVRVEVHDAGRAELAATASATIRTPPPDRT